MMTKNPKFTASSQMNVGTKRAIYKRFVECLKARSLATMNMGLYNHLRDSCGFPAGYDLHGFFRIYEGEKFADFVRWFLDVQTDAEVDWWRDRWWRDSSGVEDLNLAMIQAANELGPEIIAGIEYGIRAEKRKELFRLAAELGYGLYAKGEQA